LVRAYGDAVKEVLAILPRAEKVATHTVMIALPYNLYERVKLLLQAQHGRILDEEFAADITITAQFVTGQFPAFQNALRELSHGQLEAEVVETDQETIMPLGTLVDESEKDT
jgi:putative IMPACT (imprinted ancient) family translation regulator